MNKLIYSSDGINWTASTSGNSLFTICYSVSWNGILWVAGGSGSNRLAYSYDGIIWIASTSGNLVFTISCRSTVWNASIWVSGGNGSNTFSYSFDGINWIAFGSSIITSIVYSISWNNLQFVASGNGTNTLAYSLDGQTWSASTNGNTFFTSSYAICWNGYLWVAGGTGLNTIVYSSDGQTWSASINGNAFFTSCFAIAWNGSLWIAGGTGTNSVINSIDGKNWVNSSSGSTLLTTCNTVSMRNYLPNVGTLFFQGIAYPKLGNCFVVDQINGIDSIASIGRLPFKTINAAINAIATTILGIYTIWVLPGTYTLSSGITIPTNTCLRGLNTQTCVIQMTVTTNTTLITVSANTRIEDLTLNISTITNGVNITCVEFPSGTPQTSKLRTSVYNVTHTGTSGNAYGILSSGTSSTAQSSANAIRGCTVNVSAATGVVGRGILVNAANRFTIRDTNVTVSGSTTNGVGVETTNASSIAELRTSTIGGPTYDIDRTAGIIQMGFSDLLNTNSNGNSFSTTTEPANIIFGVIGNPGSGQTYNLVPGTVLLTSLPVTPFEFPFTQDVIIISTLIKFTGTLGVGVTISTHVHINGSSTPSIIVTLNSGENQKINNTTSVICKKNDTVHLEMVTVGNPGNGTFLTVIGLY